MPLVALTRWLEESRFGLASDDTVIARQAQAERICEARRAIRRRRRRRHETHCETPNMRSRSLRTGRFAPATRSSQLRFGGALRLYWSDRGLVAPGAAYLDSALALATDRPH
jgi:hypothetical protein